MKALKTICVIVVSLAASISIAPASDAHYEQTIKPLLAKYCIDCHNQDDAGGNIRVDNLVGQFKTRTEIEHWTRILEALAFNEMPLDTASDFPTLAESHAIQRWIADSLTQHGIDFEDKSKHEGFGNLIPHDLLFSPKERNRPIDVAARLWRISPTVLAKVLRDAGGARIISNPFELDKPEGNFRDFKAKYPLNSMMAEQVAELAIEAAKNQAERCQKDIEARRKKNEPQAEIIKSLLIRQTEIVLRRKPTNEELSQLTSLLSKVDSELGSPRGLQAAYAAIILKPESLFRYEGLGSADDQGKTVALTRRELANSLALTLTDLPPDGRLVAAFRDESKEVREILRSETNRFLRESPQTKQRLLQFFREYFDYDKANDIFKDQVPGHYHWAPSLVNDLDRLIEHTLEKDEQVFKTLLTTQEYFVHINSHRDFRSPLAYNLPPDFKPTRKLIHFPKKLRMGVLTHPAWLVAHSGNFDNDPIRRGLWVQRKLLGGNVADLPINVDAKLPDDETMTLREKLHVTRETECYKCHSKMNSLGLPFEQYDHFGRFRFDELKKPVNTQGEVRNSRVAGLDGKVKSPFELIDRLANSKHVEQVFVRHVFRFFLGRNETLGDAKTLQDAHTAYSKSNGSMKALVVSLMTSDSFCQRATRR